MKKTFFIMLAFVITVIILVTVSTGCGSSSPTTPATATATATAVPPTPVNTPCAVFGYNLDTNDNMWSGGYFISSTITASSTTVIRSIAVKMTGAAGNYFALAVYSDDSGTPKYLLASTGITADTGGWISVPITPITLTAGATYWLVMIGSGYGLDDETVVASTYPIKYCTYTWASFLSTGFPNDISSLGWGNFIAAKDLIYVSSCY